MSMASPPTPMIRWFLTTSGAVVVKYCLRALAILFAPPLLAGAGVERDHPVVGPHEVDHVLVHAYAAVADQMAAVVDPMDFSDLLFRFARRAHRRCSER